MKRKPVTNEILYYGLIFAAAVLARTLLLGRAPLGEWEASRAVQALEGGVQSLYTTLTGLAFSMFGSGNFTARIVPALLGSGLVWVPYLFRNQLGREAALAASLGLALDPGLTAVSRLAGEPILTVLFLMLTMGFLVKKRWPLAALAGGLALYTGPSLWLGVLGLGAALVIGRLTGFYRIFPELREEDGDPVENLWEKIALAGGVLFMIVTSLTRQFDGLSSWTRLLSDFLAGWNMPGPGVPASRILGALVVYQPLPLILGGLAFLPGKNKDYRLVSFLEIGFLASLGMILLYPAREVYHLVWCIVPLWGLAGIGALKAAGKKKLTLPSAVHAGAIMVVFAMMWLFFTNTIYVLDGNQWMVILAAGLLGVLFSMIVISEWNWQTARKGLVLGGILSLGIYTLAAMSGAAFLRPGSPLELWYPGSGAPQVDLLRNSLRQFSLMETGRSDAVSLTVIDDSAAVKWAVRDFEKVEFRLEAPVDEFPRLVIVRGTEDSPRWMGSYRGQDFVMRTTPAWKGAFPPGFRTWLAFREGPLTSDYNVLWVRRDIFPAGDEMEEIIEYDTPDIRGDTAEE